MPNTEGVGVRRFFIGANTAKGFVSDTEDIFGALRKVHIIKGGPGTGKSTLMKRIAAASEERGYAVERYYCSSDSTSLDGIVLPTLGVGFADGTSPHTMEAKYPGVKESLLDLGALWKEETLISQGERICALTEEKSALFSSVYRSLHAASALRSEYGACLDGCFEEGKAKAAIGRLLKRLGRGQGFSLRSRQVTGLGMTGRVCLDTYGAMAKERWLISDSRGLGGQILRLFVEAAAESSLATWVSRDPLGAYDALYFPEKGVAVLTGSEASEIDKIINSERFLRKEAWSRERGRLRFLKKLERELMGQVDATFHRIRGVHFALEEIYAGAMDFASLDALTERVIDDLFGG